jgi:hypothetical protein
MHHQDPRDPGGGRTGFAELAHRFVVLEGVRLQATVAPGLKPSEDAALDQCLDGCVGNAPRFLTLLGTGRDVGKDRVDLAL